MSDWTEGYVSDIQYIPGFFAELAPTRLAFAMLGAGKRVDLPEAGGHYLELGCGQGFGTALLAAANPEMNFTGIDFNPGQIANARQMASRAGLTNVNFLDYSFTEVLERGLPHGPYNIIVLHGIYSWVSRENRLAIVDIIGRHLAPGGLAYVSYNCLPGWAHSTPLQRLIREHAARASGRSDIRMAAGLHLAKTLVDGEALYFTANPLAKNRLEKLPLQNPNYLAHEYLNSHWNPLFVTDVASEMSRAKLSYGCSASLMENIDGVSVPPKLQELVRTEQDPLWREVLRDFASNKQFRRDLYSRGLNEFTPVEQSMMLGKTHFTLVTPRADVNLTFKGPIGDIVGQDTIYIPLCDFLAEKPRSFAEIMGIPVMAEKGPGVALQSLSLLVASAQVEPFNAHSKFLPANAQSFNRFVVDEFRRGRPLGAIATPLAKTGLVVNTNDLLYLSAVHDGKSGIEEAAKHAVSHLSKVGRKVLKDGKPLTADTDAIKHMETIFNPIAANRVPLWRALGAV
jgi:SAM-dependent methyltransferase